jgi:hypothetical protein
MEISQGNCLSSYLYLKLAKNVMFFILSFFFNSYKIENRREEQVPAWGKDWHQWKRGSVGKTW